ncbi:MAG: tyrosine-type recombinase/integrase [Magnetococcales bacterium]|nr:tyrosine-type recombinase/integrase [Magnetococcales bacterium]
MSVKLTKRIVDGAQTGERDIYLFDEDLIGFGLKITPAGRKVYLLQYRFQGSKKRMMIGVHGSPWTPDQAREEAKRLLGLVSAGQDPAEQKRQLKTLPTVADLCAHYLAEGTMHKKASTLYVDRGRIERHIIPLLGRKKVHELTRTDCERFLKAIAEGATAADIKTGSRGRAIVEGGPGTANRALGLLGAILTFAVHRGMRTDNPAHGVRKYRENRRDRFLSQEELARLGEALAKVESDGGNPVALAAIRALILTGCRKGEILGLRWCDVDFERGCLLLPDSKTGSKVVLLGAPALQHFGTLPRIHGNGFVFPGVKEGAALVGIEKIWLKVRDLAGLKDVTLHGLRHAFASVGVNAGLSLPLVGALLGHSSESMTARYGHLASDPIRQAADRISSQIAAALNGNKGEVVPLGPARQAKAH